MIPYNIDQPDLNGLSVWAPELAQTFVTLASDIALVMDDGGVIRNVVQGSSAPLANAVQEWVGRPWADTVTGETRSKVEQLLQEVTSTGLARRREINHPSDAGGHIAMAYTAIRLGENGPLLAVGRDLGAIVAIQQRFLGAQQEMERSYWRARHAESRYRLLFQVATDAVLVVNSQTFEILEANQAASQLFDMAIDQLVGRPASFGFERYSRGAVDELLTTAGSSGQQAEIRARLLGKISATSVSATPIRADDAVRLLVRVRSMEMPGALSDLNATLARLVDGASDGVVVTDSSGRIQIANPTFLKLVQLGNEADVKGRPLMDWVGVTDEQFATLLLQVRRQGITRRMTSHLLAKDARVSQIEVSAALLTEGDQECIGFTIRFVASNPPGPTTSHGDFNHALDQLTAQIGGKPLPELLRLASGMLERHFFDVAMARSNADPTAAARLLGVDPERLSMPLHRPGNPWPGSSAPEST